MRTKRDIELNQQIVVIHESDHQHECGLNARNKKHLRVEDRPFVRIRENGRRMKRSTSDLYIELSVFADDKMYESVESNKKIGEDTLQKIQEMVFAYLNAVQIIYKSSRLSNKLTLLLVRLEVMQTPDSSLKSHDGEIESYLESFCSWQKAKNPGGGGTADINDDEHWDHALLLTGYNLYDVLPERDSVIGLAWVSGMCHPDYSCTINEGNNFESVYVIAHEMGHNLGMNHDGEVSEGNSCDPSKYLMSPVLGPGKVDWSTCSDKELTNFLTGAATKSQAYCLQDAPKGVVRYDFDLDGQKPGEKFAAIDQCRQAFGFTFNPYVKEESPFEDLCRELWCSNLTHALRAHPALEGTDCSSKPFPFGSICNKGICLPFNPDEVEVASQQPQTIAEADTTTEKGFDYNDAVFNSIDGTPCWYDPIFTKIFSDLRKSFKMAHPILLMSESAHDSRASLEVGGEQVELVEDAGALNLTLEVGGEAAWNLKVEACPVQCGGGWAEVHHLCEYSGELVNRSYCQTKRKPNLEKLPCSTIPCNITQG